MFPIIRFAMQICLKQYSLGDKDSCRKFFENLLSLIKPAAAASKTELDDKILAHLDLILKNDTLFGFFYNLVREQFESETLIFESPEESAIALMCEQASEESAKAISPLVIVSIITQIIALINSMKK